MKHNAQYLDQIEGKEKLENWEIVGPVLKDAFLIMSLVNTRDVFTYGYPELEEGLIEMSNNLGFNRATISSPD